MQAALLLACSQVAHVLITIEMAIWVHNRNGDEEPPLQKTLTDHLRRTFALNP